MATDIKRYIQVYTGDGKGKTTAALGLSIRAAGHGLKTYIGQFMKGQHYGELTALRDNPCITIEQYGVETGPESGLAPRGVLPLRSPPGARQHRTSRKKSVLVAPAKQLGSLNRSLSCWPNKWIG